MKALAADKFKAQFLTLIEEIAQNHEPIIVTKSGKPLVKVIAFEADNQNADKPLKGMATFIGDIVSPIDEDWEAMQ